MTDPKALAVLALKRVAPKDDATKDDGGGEYDAGKASMQAFIDAVKGGDASAAMDAFKDVQANC